MTEVIDVFQLPCFVINLDRRPDRWKRFSEQPAIRFFPNLERMSGIDAQNLDITNDSRVSLQTKANIAKKLRRSHYEINTPGACGASLSHIRCWEMLLETNSPYGLIFEDDAKLTQVHHALIERFRHSVPVACDIWLLGHFASVQSEPYRPLSPWYEVRQFTGAHAYVIHRDAAKALLERCFPIETHIEFYICNQARQKGLTVLRHKELRVPQVMEETLVADSDQSAKDASCPLCSVDTNPHKNWLIVPRVMTYQWLSALGAVLFVSYGLVRSRVLS